MNAIQSTLSLDRQTDRQTDSCRLTDRQTDKLVNLHFLEVFQPTGYLQSKVVYVLQEEGLWHVDVVMGDWPHPVS